MLKQRVRLVGAELAEFERAKRQKEEQDRAQQQDSESESENEEGWLLITIILIVNFDCKNVDVDD